MLFGIAFRGAAFEFRERSTSMRPVWDRGFFLGSLVVALVQGAAIGAMVQELHVVDGRYAGGAFELYVSAPMRRNSRFIAFTWATYVATSCSPQRSPAIRRKPRRAKALAGPAPQRWIIAARSCFCCKVAVAFGGRARIAATLRSRNTAVSSIAWLGTTRV
jgi:Cytochrome bd terminal oxidase subunit II